MTRPSVRDRLPDDTPDHLGHYLHSIRNGGEIRPLSPTAQHVLWELILRDRTRPHFADLCHLLLKHELCDGVLWLMVSAWRRSELAWSVLAQTQCGPRTRLVAIGNIGHAPREAQKLVSRKLATAQELDIIALVNEVIPSDQAVLFGEVVTQALALTPEGYEFFRTLLDLEAQSIFDSSSSTLLPYSHLENLLEAARNL